MFLIVVQVFVGSIPIRHPNQKVLVEIASMAILRVKGRQTSTWCMGAQDAYGRPDISSSLITDVALIRLALWRIY